MDTIGYLKFIFVCPVWDSCIFMYLLSRCINIHYGCPKIDIHLGRYIINVYLWDLARKSSAVWYLFLLTFEETERQSCISRCEMFVMPGVEGKGGGRVASLARRNAWLEFQMDLSLSLCCYCETLSCAEDDGLNMKCNDWDWTIILLDIPH